MTSKRTKGAPTSLNLAVLRRETANGTPIKGWEWRDDVGIASVETLWRIVAEWAIDSDGFDLSLREDLEAAVCAWCDDAERDGMDREAILAILRGRTMGRRVT